MCTSIRLISKKDDTVVYARTNEFSTDMESAVIMVPRHFARTGTTPVSDQEGAKWESKYASVGANGLHEPFIADGLNEKGLAIGLLYFPTFADYMTYNPSSDQNITIAPWELGSWLLDQFQNVKEVKENIGKIVVANVVFPQWKFVPPLHCVVHDAEGNCIVIEYVNGKLRACN